MSKMRMRTPMSVNVPASNVGDRTEAELVKLVEGGEGTVSLQEQQRALAKTTATQFGLDVKESGTHGYGLFAALDLDVSYAGLPVEGSLQVFDNVGQVLKELKHDGGPRYAICITDGLRKLCAANESVGEGGIVMAQARPDQPMALRQFVVWFPCRPRERVDSLLITRTLVEISYRHREA